MKANSNTIPETFIKSKRNTHFNFNIVETTKEDMDREPRVSFNYDYVEIEGNVTRAKIIKALKTQAAEEDMTEYIPANVATQFEESQAAIKLSNIASMTYDELDTYIENNVTNLAEARVYLKKLSKIVLAILKSR